MAEEEGVVGVSRQRLFGWRGKIPEEMKIMNFEKLRLVRRFAGVVLAILVGTMAASQTRRTGEAVSASTRVQAKMAIRIMSDAAETPLPDRDSQYLYDPFTAGLIDGTEKDVEESMDEARQPGDRDLALGLLEELNHLSYWRDRQAELRDLPHGAPERAELEKIRDGMYERFSACRHVLYQAIKSGRWYGSGPCDDGPAKGGGSVEGAEAKRAQKLFHQAVERERPQE